MKRLGYILTEETVTKDLCMGAIREASKDKRKRPAVKKILRSIDHYAGVLRHILLSGSYKPSPYKECHIIDRPSGKERILEKPKFFPDQCVHHAVILLLGNRLIKRLDPYCLGGLQGRGAGKGVKSIKHWLTTDKKHTKYCFKGDVRKCYESIKPCQIMRAMERFIKDKRYLSLVRIIAYSHGSLPLGNYTSTWFVNLILLEVDKIARKSSDVWYYLRYIDDFIMLSSNKRKLRSLVDKVKDVLTSLGLEIKHNWQVFPVDVRGIDMLGYRFFRDYTVIRKRNLFSLTRSLRKFGHYKTAKRARGIISRVGQLKHCNSFNLLKSLNINMRMVKKVAA